MTRIDKLKEELANEYVAYGYGCDGDTSKDSFIKGFDAASNEYQKIIDPLVEALEEIAIEQEFYIKSKDYFSEVVRLNLQAKEALENYKKSVE